MENERLDITDNVAVIKVIGVGGGGNNAVNRMCNEHIDGVEFIAANTDQQVLDTNLAPTHLLLGYGVTHGLGAGGDPEVGTAAAEESLNDIKNLVRNANMVFIAAGMGGGTGTGAAPIIAKTCKELGILTIGIVTRPFTFEGKRRNGNAVEGLAKLKPYCDSLIVISNDQLLQLCGTESFQNAFKQCDDVLCHSVKIITDLILKPALINLDFNDVRAVMKNKGTALIGMGRGKGENKARIAAEEAIKSPLLEIAIKGAKNAIVFIQGGSNMTPLDFHEATQIVKEATQNPDINLIFGVRSDESFGDDMQVTVIATEFENSDIHFVDKDDDYELNLDTLDITKLEQVEPNKEESTEEITKEEETEEVCETIEVNEKKSHRPLFLRRRKR